VSEELDLTKCLRTLEFITVLFVNHSYEALIAFTSKSTLSAKELSQEVDDWKYPFILPPDVTVDNLVDGQIRKVEKGERSLWLIDMYLWTKEEGKSDLMFSLVLRSSSTILYEVEIDNLHVL